MIVAASYVHIQGRPLRNGDSPNPRLGRIPSDGVYQWVMFTAFGVIVRWMDGPDELCRVEYVPLIDHVGANDLTIYMEGRGEGGLTTWCQIGPTGVSRNPPGAPDDRRLA